MKDIFRILEKNYIYKLFEKKKLVYFPETKNKKITLIEIEKNSPDWAKETCLTKYTIFFDDKTHKIVRGTAGVIGSKEKVWQIMNFLYSRGFSEGESRIAKPFDFIKDINLLLYEEAQGEPFSLVIQRKDIVEIEDILKRVAKWLAKLHGQNFKKETGFLSAVSVEKSEYDKIFAQIKNLIPGLENDLIFDFEFFDNIFLEQKTLIHNDFYPGNIVVSREIIYGIDFEKSGFGFGLMDVATFLGWFDFPEQIRGLNFSEEEISNFQDIFLAEYCRLSRQNQSKIEEVLNKYLAKIFLDQVYNYATICVKGWNYFKSADRIKYEEKIRALVQKARQHF